jgi:hypothetical protein
VACTGALFNFTWRSLDVWDREHRALELCPTDKTDLPDHFFTSLFLDLDGQQGFEALGGGIFTDRTSFGHLRRPDKSHAKSPMLLSTLLSMHSNDFASLMPPSLANFRLIHLLQLPRFSKFYGTRKEILRFSKLYLARA